MSRLIDTGKIKSAERFNAAMPGKAVIKTTLTGTRCSACGFDVSNIGLINVDGYKYCPCCGSLVLVDKKVTE